MTASRPGFAHPFGAGPSVTRPSPRPDVFERPVFGEPARAQPYARLDGTVLHAQRKTVVVTGQEFVAARVRTAGFGVDVCLPADGARPLPPAGGVIAGTV